MWPTVVFLCSRRRLVFVCIGLVLMGIATRIGLVLAGYYTAAYFFYRLVVFKRTIEQRYSCSS